MMKNAVLAIAAALLLVACKGEDPQAAAQAAAAQAAAEEQKAEAMAKQFDEAMAAQNWHLAKGYGEVLQIEHPSSAAAARIRQPALLLWCKQDAVIDASALALYAQRIPQARKVLLDGCGHMSIMERPRQVADAVLALVQNGDGGN